MSNYQLVMTGETWATLAAHLFPGDHDEHGAVLGVSQVSTERGVRLLVRELRLAGDGVDYVPGEQGYRMLTPEFVRDAIIDFSNVGLGYLAAHCHGGTNEVGFSADDMNSHERGYPALRDLADGSIVGGLVFASSAIAGDLWLSDGTRVELTSARVAGRPMKTLFPGPPAIEKHDAEHDRQARIFGDRGQAVLDAQKVAVIGAGGAGSLLVEYLARLGVGHLVIIDPDRVETTNLPRIIGSRRFDAHTWVTSPQRPKVLQALGRRFASHKVHVARRVAQRARPTTKVDAVVGDIIDAQTAQLLIDCDYIFLAADSMQARLVFNAIVHQYLIPGAQVGAKVQVDKATGEVVDVFSVSRPIVPGFGCLWCNSLISSSGLQEEALDPATRERQRYVDDDTVPAPSVITLNAVAAAHAADDYLFSVTELLDKDAPHRWFRFTPREAGVELGRPRRDKGCTECGTQGKGRLAQGPARSLPTRSGQGRPG